MFAIAFDPIVAETRKRHPKGVALAYLDIGAVLEQFSFRRVQGSVAGCVRDIRAFKIEQWSDFTAHFKS